MVKVLAVRGSKMVAYKIVTIHSAQRCVLWTMVGDAVVDDAMVLWRVAGSACCALVLCSVFCSITVRSPRGVSGSHTTVQCKSPCYEGTRKDPPKYGDSNMK